MAKKKKKAANTAAKRTAARRRPARTTRARVSTRRQAAPAATFESATFESVESGAAEPRPRARGGRAPETIQVIFDLLDVSGRPIRDPETFFTFRRLSDNRQISDQLQVELAGAAPVFELPVATGEVAVCEIDPRRYRFVHSPMFFRSPGPPIRKESVLLREPGQWAAKFTRWNDLPPAFAELKRALTASPNVTLFRGTDAIGERLVEGAYDGLSGADVALAKTALLNIYYRLTQSVEPVSSRSWFSFVTRIVAIGRERLLAFVEPELETRIRDIHDHIDQFRSDYERTPAENHRRNVPVALQNRITEMVSIKSTHRKGNFQLTLTRLTGPDEVLLDTDIDESGDLLGHTLDLFKHKITGGTHPHDIHELLTVLDGKSPGFDLGYQLI